MNNTQRLASIDTLLGAVPKFECNAGCADCCGPVVMSRLEMKRICERTGMQPGELDFVTVMNRSDHTCPLLDKSTNRCTVYDIRPAICKVFGSSEHKRLRCPHGCQPDKSLSDQETDRLITETERLGHGFPAHSHALLHKLKLNL